MALRARQGSGVHEHQNKRRLDLRKRGEVRAPELPWTGCRRGETLPISHFPPSRKSDPQYISTPRCPSSSWYHQFLHPAQVDLARRCALRTWQLGASGFPFASESGFSQTAPDSACYLLSAYFCCVRAAWCLLTGQCSLLSEHFDRRRAVSRQQPAPTPSKLHGARPE